MKMPNKLLIALCAILSGCATPTERFDWVMVGGSKADGNVTLGIDVPPKMWVTETLVEYDLVQANAEAEQGCKNWGYAGAKMYGEGQFPITIVCHPQGVSPCWSKTYRVYYQCTGDKYEQLKAPRLPSKNAEPPPLTKPIGVRL